MNFILRNLLLSVALVAVPTGGFAVAKMLLSPPAQIDPGGLALPGLGDLSAYKTIVTDTQSIAASRDFTAAEHRITDLETLWDRNAATLRNADRAAWTTVDMAADEAFAALRASKPDLAAVKTALDNLVSALDAPVPALASGPVQTVGGIAVTDENGRARPCEDLIGQLRDAIGATTPNAAIADLQSKAIERCNADDDAHADAYAAQALALIKG